MIFAMIPQELHEQLLDLKNYQNRTNGVEELKSILFDLDLNPVSSDNIVEFISFLRKLLDDTNFKVLYSTLQVMNLLIDKLNYSVDKYLKQIVCAALKALGDTRIIARIEYMNIFRQLKRFVGPQKVIDLIIGQLRHKNSRVREDVLNIITAGMLTHPRKDFNIPSLCFEVAPCLADSKKKVRHAALELFAVFDYCLDTGRKQPLIRAINRVELSGEVEGLMAAIQARRARHILPRLSPEGIVEYALVVPRPGQRGVHQFGSGADLEWVVSGGRISSCRSRQTEPDADGVCNYGSLGSLIDVVPQHRRIVSAGKGKNRLPWERSTVLGTVKPLNGTCSNRSSVQVLNQGSPSPGSEAGREPCRFGDAVGQDHRRSPLHSLGPLARSPSSVSLRHSHSEPHTELPALRRHSDLPVEQAMHLDGVRPSPEAFPEQKSPQQELSQVETQVQEEEEDEAVDHEEMMRSLRCLRFSAAKKRAKMSQTSSDPDPDLDPEQDPDSPDSAVKLELGPETPPFSSIKMRAITSRDCSPLHESQSNNRQTSSTSEGITYRAEWKLNGNMVAKSKAESSSEDSSASPASPSYQPSPSFKPHPPRQPRPTCKPSPPPQANLPLQPSPPVEPHRPTRLRKALSLNKARTPFSPSSDELSPGKEKPDLQPLFKPEQSLSESFSLISSDDWEKKITGFNLLRRLAQFHPDILLPTLHDICRVTAGEVKNLRSGVARVAVMTMGELFLHLQKEMDPELDTTVKVLLHKSGESNVFIRQDVDTALAHMVQNCTHARAVTALLGGGLQHLNTTVRKCTAQHLADLMEMMGADRLMSGNRDFSERVLRAVIKLAHDPSQEARHYGRRMLSYLASHEDFDRILERYIPRKDHPTIKSTVLSVRTKELGGTSQTASSARRGRLFNGSSTIRAASLSRDPASYKEDSEEYCCKGQASNIAEKTEYINQLNALMTSKDFRDRSKALEQLAVDCKQNPEMVIATMLPVFDAIKARLQESNSKVNLCALRSLHKIIALLKDNMAQVVSILIPAIVDNHLNSKNNAIYNAAIGVIHALMENLDNAILLQPFCTKAQFLSGKAKVDLIEKVADMVNELYPRKPQVVEQKVLPLLWYLLGTSSKGGNVMGRGCSLRKATANLCQALHTHMGAGLAESASSQHPSVYKSFNEMLNSL